MGKRKKVTRVSPEKKDAEKNCGRRMDDHVMCCFRKVEHTHGPGAAYLVPKVVVFTFFSD